MQGKRRQYDQEVENLERQQKQTIERLEQEHTNRLRDEAKRIKGDQDKELSKFQNMLKNRKKEVQLCGGGAQLGVSGGVGGSGGRACDRWKLLSCVSWPVALLALLIGHVVLGSGPVAARPFCAVFAPGSFPAVPIHYSSTRCFQENGLVESTFSAKHHGFARDPCVSSLIKRSLARSISLSLTLPLSPTISPSVCPRCFATCPSVHVSIFP